MKTPSLVNCAPERQRGPDQGHPLGVTRCGVAAELLFIKSSPQTHVPRSPAFCSVPGRWGVCFLVLLF